MAPDISDPWLESFILALAIASFATWITLLKRRKAGPILPYEPRCPVPWNGIWTLLPVGYAAIVVIAVFTGGPPDAAADRMGGGGGGRLALGALQQLIFTAVYLVGVIFVSSATGRDLGLPQSLEQWQRDLKIGIIGWLAALLPVYAAQFILVLTFGQPKGHPLVKLLEGQAEATLFAIAFLIAVIIAPVCEEVLFRLILQGWLEKYEDTCLGWRVPQFDTSGAETEPVAIGTPADENLTGDIEPMAAAEPPQFGLLGLPYGWLPIGLSSFVFAMAHFGYGPDPIPLFLLALILGYQYQRTHRILPAMITHALFNSMTLFALWRMINLAAE